MLNRLKFVWEYLNLQPKTANGTIKWLNLFVKSSYIKNFISVDIRKYISFIFSQFGNWFSIPL